MLMENRVTELINDRKVTKATNLKIGQLVFVKDHHNVLLTRHILWSQDFSNSKWKHVSTHHSRWQREEVQHLPYQANVRIRVISKCFPTVSGWYLQGSSQNTARSTVQSSGEKQVIIAQLSMYRSANSTISVYLLTGTHLVQKWCRILIQVDTPNHYILITLHLC